MTSTPSVRQSWFATTRWSVVVSAGEGDARQSRMAMEQLCADYWKPLYSYVRRRGYDAEDAQDLTQEFFARLLQGNRVAHAHPQKGKFRAFLLGSLKNFLIDEWDKSRAQKRGGNMVIGSLQVQSGEAVYELEPVNNVTPEQIFERRWALTLLENVVRKLEAEYRTTDREKLYHALSPCLAGEKTAQPYAKLAAELNQTENAIKSAVYRLRSRYRELLRNEIANTLTKAEDIDEEINYLFEVLGRS